MARSSRKPLQDAIPPEPASTPPTSSPALTAEDLAGLRVAFARDAMMQVIAPCFDPRNIGVNLNDAAAFSVQAADALVAALIRKESSC